MGERDSCTAVPLNHWRTACLCVRVVACLQEDMKTFFRLIGEFFPCDECARHFRGLLAEDPPDVRSNLYLSLWLCKAHNIVNRRVGNQEYPCTEEFITQRWGSCGCSDTNDDSGSGEEGGDAETPQSIFQHDSIDDDDDEDMAQANSAA